MTNSNCAVYKDPFQAAGKTIFLIPASNIHKIS